MWQLSIDTGGTFTDGLARDPAGNFHRIKVLSSSCLRGRFQDGKVSAPWLTAPIFGGYRVQVLETGQTATIVSLTTDGILITSPTLQLTNAATIQLSTGEEAPVLAARLLTQTPLNQSLPPLEMRLGTTRGTNALLERRGGRVALLVTKGFKDLLLIGTQQRPNLFQLAIPPAEVLYETVLEVDERTTATGEIRQPLSPETLARIITDLQKIRPDAIAISFLNAYRNPIHEQQVADALTEAGFLVVTRSTEVSAAPGYVARTQTAVIDAYLTPVLRQYLANVQAQLGEHPVRVMTSAGGLVRADLFRPKDSLLSGPAGGVIGAAHVAQTYGPALTLDMGGTSTDVARCDGPPDYRFSTTIGPFALQLPSLAIETVAAGGGSVCWFDAVAGQLRVGPQSAGANPGPACYGAGAPGQPLLLTITDVNLLTGRLLPRQFGIPVFADKAEAALNALIRQIETVADAAPERAELLAGLLQIANEAMAGAIRKISVSRGLDPAWYSLLLFGGAGGLHGCGVADLLGIKRLILPFDGGLLSAVGIGQARIERVGSRSVLRLLAGVHGTLPDLVSDLIAQTTAELREDTGPETPVDVRSCWLAMRLAGQESTLDVAFQDSGLGALVADFQARYRSIYGHYPETATGQPRPVEVESIRVVVSRSASENQAVAAFAPESIQQQTMLRPEPGDAPAYNWPMLNPGDTFAGPALLLNTTSSAYIEAGWTATVEADLMVIARKDVVEPLAPVLKPGQKISGQSVIQTELFARRFMAVAGEMGAQLQRTAFSVNVKERLDFSCAVLDADGRLVANAPHIPVHLGSLGVCTRLVTSVLPLGPGDVAITNHPGFGGSHLPDVTLIQAVFADSDNINHLPQRIGYVVNRAHHAEIGGKVPGSMPPDATSLVEEGVVLEPMYVVRNGQFLWDPLPESPGIATRFTNAPYPTRALAENRADIEAAIASLRTGETALRELARQHGPDTVRHYMNQLAQTATDALRRVLKPLDGQAFDAEEWLDDGHRICVKITVKNERVTFDFRGTSAVHPRNLNANISILNSAVLYVLRLWVDEDIPLNEGLMEPVSIILPESTLLNPVFSDDPAQCPAVVGGNTEVSQRLVDALLKALNLSACSAGTMNNFLFGNDNFGYYETIGGGAGATEGQAGRSGVHQNMTNTKLTDPEELERRYPVRLHEFSLRPNSGGAGRWRGGDGLIRDIEFLEPVQATLLSQHRLVAPYGINGGEPGAVGQQFLIGTDGVETKLPGIFTRAMLPGERIRIETPGGGGVGAAA